MEAFYFEETNTTLPPVVENTVPKYSFNVFMMHWSNPTLHYTISLLHYMFLQCMKNLKLAIFQKLQH